MFRLGERIGDVRHVAYQLDVFLPIDLYLLDLGGGLEPTPGSRKVKRSQVRSAPLAALLGGMLHEKIPRYGPKPIDVGGFLSVMARHALADPTSEPSFRDPCYAIVSDRYLNYTARVGYHFSVVDAYTGGTPNKNYISFRFRGGAADDVRRARRASAIAGVLRDAGFAVETRGDDVTARLTRLPRDEALRHLDALGRLLQFMRQMDVAMVDDASVERVKAAFERGDYDLTSRRPTPAR